MKLITLFLLMIVFNVATPVLATEPVAAVVSNLSDFNYPQHKCGSKPSRPQKLHHLIPKKEVDTYNIAVAKYNVEVSIFNKNIKQYKKCINTYIKNGNQDIQTIRDQLNAALKEARN